MENYCAYCMSPRKGAFCGFCGHRVGEYVPLPHHLQPGTQLNGKYLLGRVLGEGGFGITYMGLDQLLGLKVAIKEYFPSGLVNRNSTVTQEVSANLGDSLIPFEKGRSRFLQEAQILARFAGEPGIVGIRDFFTANNTAYIVMEYLEGVTLRDHLKNNGPMTFDAAVTLLQPVMQSLRKVHQLDLIHRDISPDNIMLLKNGQVKLLDFGAARNVTGVDERSLSVMLKPGFAPEEQYRTKGHQGPWTDVYALSATIYRCITGQNPEESMNRVFVDENPLPSQLGAVITPIQEAALMKGLAVLQKNRYQTVGALLEGFSGKEPVAAVAAAAPAPAAPGNDTCATGFEPAPGVVASRVQVSQNRTARPMPGIQPSGAPDPETSAPVEQKKNTPAAVSPAPAASPAPVKKRSPLLLIPGTVLFLGGWFLLALGVYGYLDKRETVHLVYGVMGLLGAACGVLLSLRYTRSLPRDTSSVLCRVLGFLTIAELLLMLSGMLLAGATYSFYILQILGTAAYAYLMLNSGFASHKGRKRLRTGYIIGLVLVILALVFSVLSTAFTTVTIGDQRIKRDATDVSIAVDMLTHKQLEELSKLRQLEKLSITASFLDDSAIPYIAELTNLTSLRLVENSDITDVSGLSALTKLTVLDLGGTSVTDISCVEAMPELTELSIDGTQVADPTPINGLSNLTSLDLSGLTMLEWSKLVIPATVYNLWVDDTGISNLSMVSTMDELYILSASGNNITEVLPLQKFEEADNITLSDNDIADLTGLPNCRTLYLSNNALTDISPISVCGKLWNLEISDNQITDVSPLGNCPQLGYLYIANNQIADISSFVNLNLTYLDMSCNQITDISSLSSCISLNYLHMNDNQVSDISVLRNMPELHTLRAYNNLIGDISPILDTSIPEQETWLQLQNNKITDISPLAECQALNRVELSGNPITDLSPLKSCPVLSDINASETQVTDISCLSGMTSLAHLEVIRTNISGYDISPVYNEDGDFFLKVSYREDMDYDQIQAMKDEGTHFYFYDVPENMLRVVGNYGVTFTATATDLYLHPVEEITEAIDGVTEVSEESVDG